VSGDYLDASLILATLIDEDGSTAADAFVRAAPGGLLISEFASAEVASSLSRLTRAAQLTADAAQRRLESFDDWVAAIGGPIDVEASDVRMAGRIVRRFDLMLRAPDALHLAMTQRLSARLITMDRRLATAASDLGVDVALVSAQA
jgi:predicted nucleic acid-binding protein